MPVFRNDLETRTWGLGGYRTSYKIIDEDGNVQDLNNTDTILYMQYQELKAIRMMLTHMTGSGITDDDISNF